MGPGPNSRRARGEADGAGAALRGGYLAARNALDRAFLDKTEDLLLDIIHKQADLALQSEQNAMTVSHQVVSVAVDLHNKVQDRALATARALVEMAVLEIDAEAKRLAARNETLKTDAEVWKTRFDVEALGPLERHKTLLESAKLEADVQRLAVDIYSAQNAAAKTLADLYVTQMEGAKLDAQLNEAKLTQAKLAVETFASHMNAIGGQYDAWGKSLSAAKIETELFTELTKAFVAETDAAKARQDAEISLLDAAIKENDAKLKLYETRLEAEKARVGALTSANESVAKLYGVDVDAYAAAVEAEGTGAEVRTKVFTAEIEARSKEVALLMDSASKKLTLFFEALRLMQDGLKASAQLSTQVVASAMNGLNASVGLSFSGGESLSGNLSKGVQASNSVSESESSSQGVYTNISL